MQDPVDFYDDSNQQHLYAINKLYGLPGFVKDAEMEPREKVDALNTSVFADPQRRKFPCHSKAATWFANAYFRRALPLYSKKEAAFIQDRITKFAGYWGIQSLVSQFNVNFDKMAQYELASQPDEKFALVVKDASGSKVRRFPITDAWSVKLAGEHLHANRFRYPYEWRKTAARRILKEAIYYNELHKQGKEVPGSALGRTHFDMDTREYLERASGLGISHPLQAAEKVARRVMMLKGQEDFKDHAVKLAQIATALSDMDKASPEKFRKLASIVDAVDRETGLYQHYCHGVEMPEEMFFNILEKEAEEVLNRHVRLTTGRTYPVNHITKLSLDKIAEVMGSDFSDAVRSEDGITVDSEKFAEIAPTLPRDDAALLEQALDEALREPIKKEARAALMSNRSFDKDELIKQFKEEGKQVAEEDFQLTIR